MTFIVKYIFHMQLFTYIFYFCQFFVEYIFLCQLLLAILSLAIVLGYRFLNLTNYIIIIIMIKTNCIFVLVDIIIIIIFISIL